MQPYQKNSDFCNPMNSAQMQPLHFYKIRNKGNPIIRNNAMDPFFFLAVFSTKENYVEKLLQWILLLTR